MQLRIDRAAIDEAFANISSELQDEDKNTLVRQAAKMAALVKTPERIRAIVADLVEHYQRKIEPNGFKAQVVTFDRESCVLYKHELDRLLPTEASEIVMTVPNGDSEYKQYERKKDEEEKLLDRFRNPKDPLKILIVTAKLLTGFRLWSSRTPVGSTFARPLPAPIRDYLSLAHRGV